MASSRENSGRQLYTGNSNQGSITSPITNPPIFSTPSQIVQREQSSCDNQENTSQDIISDPSTSNQMEALVTRYYYHQELDKAHEQMKREEHEKRLKALRKELDGIAATQWMYSPIEKLIGQ